MRVLKMNAHDKRNAIAKLLSLVDRIAPLEGHRRFGGQMT
jgi:hypothetical protein